MFTVIDILSSGGLYPDRVKHATAIHHHNAQVLCERLNKLFMIIGVTKKPRITSAFRVTQGKGAKRSAHLEAMAIDWADPGHKIAHLITNDILVRCKLRREDTDYTRNVHQDGGVSEWCHCDTRQPYRVFKP